MSGIVNSIKKILNGLVANDGSGDSLRAGANTINGNWDVISSAVNLLAASIGSGVKPYWTLALLNADTLQPDGTVGLVTNDPVQANNAAYTSHGGVWTASFDRIALLNTALGSSSGFQQAIAGAILRTFLDKNAEVVSIKDFGAIGDGVRFTQAASISSGSNSLTIVGGALTPADVGKTIGIYGAAGAGSDLVTTIASVTSSTTCTIAANATATVANSAVAYGSDNTSAMSKALASGKRLRAPAGIYLHKNTLAFSGGCMGLIGDGRGTETGATNFVCLAQNAPAITAQGSRHKFSGFRIGYLGLRTGTSAHTIQVPSGTFLLKTIFEDIDAENGYTNMCVAGATLDTVAWRDVALSRWTYGAFYSGEVGASTGATGCSIDNVYAANQDYDGVTLLTSAYYPHSFIGFSEIKIGKIAAEWMTLNKNAVYYFENTNVAEISIPRCERITYAVNNSAFISASGNCQVNARSFMSDYCTLSTSNGVTNFYVGKTSGQATITFDKVCVRNYTVTGTSVGWANCGGTRTAAPYGGCFFNSYSFDASFTPVGQSDSSLGPDGERSIRRLELYAALTVTPGAIANGAAYQTSITVTNAERGDLVTGSCGTSLSGCGISFHINASNTVSVTITNNTGATVTLGSCALRCRVTKW